MYMRLGEMNNAVRTLKQLLSLDEAAPVGAVVDAVGRLCVMPGKLTCSQRSSQTSPGSDCTRAWLELYEEFFPAFQQLVQQLKDTLGIDSLDAILPTVQRLKAESRGRPSR
ncbi:centrosomal protein of 70 kDa [Lampetra fluviatilis]